MFSYRALALAASAFICTSQAEAATIVQSGRDFSGGAVIFQKFDNAVGTLNSVTVEATYQSSLFYRYSAFFGDPLVSAKGTVGGSNIPSIIVDQTIQASRFDPNIISIFVGGPARGYYTGDLSAYIGTGPFSAGNLSFSVFADITASVAGAALQRINPPVTGQSSSSFTLTYDFTPSIPEPTTWALMLAGFGMVGYAMRRRGPRVVYA